MDYEILKKNAAEAAMDYLRDYLTKDMVLGVGTGSTTEYFIQKLVSYKHLFDGCVSSSERSTYLLKELGIPVCNLNSVNGVPFYVDGADEINQKLQLIKGGGGALTREKIIASVAQRFICIADQSKLVHCLGDVPLPVEVIPMARGYVAKELLHLGGYSQWREGVVTDEGNGILDVTGLDLAEPEVMEQRINQIPGVVMNGLFAVKPADELIMGAETGIKTIKSIVK